MNTLLEIFNESLETLPCINSSEYQNMESFINDDKKSLLFINNLLGDANINEDDKSKQNYGLTQARARHSAITLLYGLAISEFGGLFGKLSSIFNNENGSAYPISSLYSNYYLWLITSLNHDAGYYSTKISKENLKLENIYKRYNLLDDSFDFGYPPLMYFEKRYNHILKNSYQQIKNYFDYSKHYHKHCEKNKSKECSDHGIVGGIEIFDKVLTSNLKGINPKDLLMQSPINNNYVEHDFCRNDILMYKAACLTICQHNIFKSSSAKYDKIYKKFNITHLCKNSEYKIDADTPLLLFLSIVDTIESVKIFSKSINNEEYLKTLTVLKNIKLDVTKDKIKLDYKDLYDYIITNKKSTEIFDTYMHNLKSLSSWTTLKTSYNKEKQTFIISQ